MAIMSAGQGWHCGSTGPDHKRMGVGADGDEAPSEGQFHPTPHKGGVTLRAPALTHVSHDPCSPCVLRVD